MNTSKTVIFLIFMFISNHVICETVFDKTTNQVMVEIQSSDIVEAREAMHGFVYNNIENRDKSALKIIDFSLTHTDEKIRQLALAALHRIMLVNRLGSNSVVNIADVYPIVGAVNNTSYKDHLYRLADDNNADTRVGALETLLLGYGADRKLELKILEKLKTETDKTKKRNLVYTLGMGKFSSNDTKELLISILDTGKGEASEVAAYVFFEIAPNDVSVIPKVLAIAESDERYADDDLLNILRGYEHHLIPYQSRIHALISGIDERISSGKASKNFIRHAQLLKNTVVSLDNKISLMKNKRSSIEVRKQLSSTVPVVTEQSIVDSHSAESSAQNNEFLLTSDNDLWYLLFGFPILLIIGLLWRKRRQK